MNGNPSRIAEEIIGLNRFWHRCRLDDCRVLPTACYIWIPRLAGGIIVIPEDGLGIDCAELHDLERQGLLEL